MTHTIPPRDSDDWIFTHLLNKKTLVFSALRSASAWEWAAAILFAPNEAVVKAAAKAQIAAQNRATANPTQPESNARFERPLERSPCARRGQ